jgi:DNA-binding transcriptional regulator GbsR (MarR family)
MTITETILSTLAKHPLGMTCQEVAAATGMASYNVSGKLSRLAAYGTIEGIKIAGERRTSYRAKAER